MVGIVMKVKWTTITEDESTWPKRLQTFIIEISHNHKKYAICDTTGTYTQLMDNLRFTFINSIGLRWRPTPNTHKSKKITAEDYIKIVSDIHTFDGAPQTIAGRLHIASSILEMDKKVKKEKIEIPADIFRKLLMMTNEVRDADKASKNWNFIIDNFIPVNECETESKTPILDKLQDFKSEDARFLSWIHARIEFQYGENRDFDYMIKLRNIIEKLEKIESPWKSTKIKPTPGTIMFLKYKGKISNLLYTFMGNLPNIPSIDQERFKSFSEWMEIPE